MHPIKFLFAFYLFHGTLSAKSKRNVLIYPLPKSKIQVIKFADERIFDEAKSKIESCHCFQNALFDLRTDLEIRNLIVRSLMRTCRLCTNETFIAFDNRIIRYTRNKLIEIVARKPGR